MMRIFNRTRSKLVIKKWTLFVTAGLLVLASFGCNLPAMATLTETPTSSIPTSEPSPTLTLPATTLPPTETGIVETQLPTTSPTVELTTIPTQAETPLVIPSVTPSGQKNEAILILEPGPGSRITSPVRVAGEADSVFEQTLGVRIVQDDGTILALGPVFIESELGQRGPFSVDVPFEVSAERQAVVQVFAASPRDGGTTHLASVGVLLANSGQTEISQREPHGEQIQILLPVVGSTVSGGTVHVEGIAVASFEQHLVVEIQDMNGEIVGSMPVTVQSAEMGLAGPFSVDVPYEIDSAGPGRIVVRDPSPAFEVDLHLASVEVNQEP